MTNFGKRLKELRKAAGLTQEELAQEFGIDRASLANWELGNREPSINTIIRIANYFNVSTDYLLGHEAVEKPNCRKWYIVYHAEDENKIDMLRCYEDGEALFMSKFPNAPHINEAIKILEEATLILSEMA